MGGAPRGPLFQMSVGAPWSYGVRAIAGRSRAGGAAAPQRAARAQTRRGVRGVTGRVEERRGWTGLDRAGRTTRSQRLACSRLPFAYEARTPGPGAPRRNPACACGPRQTRTFLRSSSVSPLVGQRLLCPLSFFDVLTACPPRPFFESKRPCMHVSSRGREL